MGDGSIVDEGWLKFFYKARFNPLLKAAVPMGVWAHLLCRVYHQDKLLNNGTLVKRGDAIYSEVQLAKDLEITRKVLRRILTAFEKEEMIKVVKRDRNGTHVSLCNWSTYQPTKQERAQQRNSNGTGKEQKRNSNGTGKEQKRNSNVTQSKNTKKTKKEKKIENNRLFDTQINEIDRIDDPMLKQEFQSWLDYKAENKKPYGPVGLKKAVTRVLRLAESHGVDLIVSSIEKAISSGWQGYEHGLEDTTQKANSEQNSFHDTISSMIGGSDG